MSHVLHRTVRDQPPIAVRGEGSWIYLADGRKVFDASGGAAVACLGHGNRRVAGAIAAQAGRLGYAHTGFFSSEPAEQLAEFLVGEEPGGLTHAFFVSSGSEAVESALKLARQYHLERGEPERVHFISRRQSYHGNSFGGLAASGNPRRRGPYEAILPINFSRVSPCFAYHYQGRGEAEADYVERLADELDSEFQRIGPGKVIAFIAEPVVGASAGCVTAVPGYFPAIRAVCDRHGALLILDEIMCGMGRTGTTHAWSQEQVTPDIQTIAKGLGGGYQPIGGVLASRRVIEALDRGTGGFVHGHTYQAHPVACAAALEVQRIIREDALTDRVRRLGASLETALKQRLRDQPLIGDIRGRGFFWAVELVADQGVRTPFDPELGVHELVKDAALEVGLGIYPTPGTMDGRSGDHFIISPAFNVREDEIELIADRTSQALEIVRRRLA